MKHRPYGVQCLSVPKVGDKEAESKPFKFSMCFQKVLVVLRYLPQNIKHRSSHRFLKSNFSVATPKKEKQTSKLPSRNSLSTEHGLHLLKAPAPIPATPQRLQQPHNPTLQRPLRIPRQRHCAAAQNPIPTIPAPERRRPSQRHKARPSSRTDVPDVQAARSGA